MHACICIYVCMCKCILILIGKHWVDRGDLGGLFCSLSANIPSKQLRASCSRHSCCRSVQALAHMLCHVPPMGFWSQFCFILHPHCVSFPFPPTFASPGGTSLFKSMNEQLCWRQHLEPLLTNDPKKNKTWGWGHFMVQINSPLGNHRWPMNVDIGIYILAFAYVLVYVYLCICIHTRTYASREPHDMNLIQLIHEVWQPNTHI